MRTRTVRALFFATVFLFGETFPSTEASAQCPTFPGVSSPGCGAVINITETGATVTPTGAGPYDGIDDTLVGVTNNIPACTGAKSQTACGLSIFSLDLKSSAPICGFDGDGINTYGAPGNSKDTTGYGGPNAYFTNIASDVKSCRVNFITPIAIGKTSYFSLEEALSNSNSCTTILNNSLKGATGSGFTPAPVGTGPNSVNTTEIRATFVPQGTNPSTGKAYTLAEAAQVCGFLDFDWQQTITAWPAPSNLFARCAAKDASGNPIPQVAPPSFNDPPCQGFTYQTAYTSALPLYYDPAPSSTHGMSLSKYKTTTQLSFFDAPNDPLLPAGKTMDFTTELVGLQGTSIATAAVVPTGIRFTWKSNHKGSTGGTTVTGVDPSGTSGPVDHSGTGGPTVASVSQASTYTGVGVTAINGSNNVFGLTSLLSAVLPASRSVQVNSTATAFATMINTGTTTATACSIASANGFTGTFAYQTTNSATNSLTGSVNTPVNIPAGGSQSFVIALTPTAIIAPTDLGFNFACSNTTPAPIVTGLNTLLFSASTTPTPDIVVLAATVQNDGIVHVAGSPRTGAFAVATVNLGAGASITVSADTGDAALPLTIALCQTNPSTGACLQTPSAKVTTTINANTTPTFGIFVSASAAVPFDPAGSRIFVKFSDSGNAVRGETSVAVTAP